MLELPINLGLLAENILGGARVFTEKNITDLQKAFLFIPNEGINRVKSILSLAQFLYNRDGNLENFEHQILEKKFYIFLSLEEQNFIKNILSGINMESSIDKLMENKGVLNGSTHFINGLSSIERTMLIYIGEFIKNDGELEKYKNYVKEKYNGVPLIDSGNGEEASRMLRIGYELRKVYQDAEIRNYLKNPKLIQNIKDKIPAAQHHVSDTLLSPKYWAVTGGLTYGIFKSLQKFPKAVPYAEALYPVFLGELLGKFLGNTLLSEINKSKASTSEEMLEAIDRGDKSVTDIFISGVNMVTLGVALRAVTYKKEVKISDVEIKESNKKPSPNISGSSNERPKLEIPKLETKKNTFTINGTKIEGEVIHDESSNLDFVKLKDKCGVNIFFILNNKHIISNKGFIERIGATYSTRIYFDRHGITNAFVGKSEQENKYSSWNYDLKRYTQENFLIKDFQRAFEIKSVFQTIYKARPVLLSTILSFIPRASHTLANGLWGRRGWKVNTHKEVHLPETYNAAIELKNKEIYKSLKKPLKRVKAIK